MPVWSEIELGVAARRASRHVGITGTNGKTTTTELLGAIVRAAGTAGRGGGNVGRPLCALDGRLGAGAWIVCELSSFQLEDVDDPAPPRRRAAQPDARPPRPARHVEAYRRREAADLREPGAGRRGRRPARLRAGAGPGTAGRVRGRRPAAGRAAHPGRPQPRERGRRDRRRPRARHPRRRDRGGAAHRSRASRTGSSRSASSSGVRFVNDSKATNPESASVALAAYPPGLRVILGGSRKGTPFDGPRTLRARAHGVARAYLIGETADDLAEALLGAEDVPVHRLRRSRHRGRAGVRATPTPARSCCSRPPARASTSSRLRAPRRALPRARGGAVSASRVVSRPSAASVERQRRRARAPVSSSSTGSSSLVTLGLVAFGLVMVYSASSARAAVGADDPAYFLKRQAVYAARGLVAVLSSSRGSTIRALTARCRPAPRVSLFLLVAVLVVGTTVNGAKRWLIRRPGHDPAVRAREARARDLGRRLPRAEAGAGTFGSSLRPIGLVVGARGAARPARARPRHRDRVRDPRRRDAARLRHAAAPMCSPRPRGGTIVLVRWPLARAVPARAAAQLPESVGRRAGRRLPVRAGADRARLRRPVRRRPRRERAEGLLPAGGADGHDLRRSSARSSA